MSNPSTSRTRRLRRFTLVGIAAALVVALVPVHAEPVPLARSEPGLRDLAARSGRTIGTATGLVQLSDPQLSTTLLREYNLVAPANDLKWSYVHPHPQVYNFGPAEAQIAFAEANGLGVIGHTLAWKNGLPDYVRQAGGDPERLRQLLHDHVAEVVGHFRGRIDWWDVVNEPMDKTGRLFRHIWSNNLGRTYIDRALEWAHQADPGAKLFINEYRTEGFSPKSDGLHRLVRNLVADGIPLHGVGFQFHVKPKEVPSQHEIVANFRRFADLGLDILITELDIRVPTPPTAHALELQGQLYRRIMAACLAVPRCRSVTTWGITDRYSWSERHFPGEGAALPFDKVMREKPAYFGMAQAMGMPAPEASVREAEKASVRTTGSTQPGAWRLPKGGELADVFPVRRGGAHVITFVAKRAMLAGPAPTLQVEVDGHPVSTLPVASLIPTAHHVVVSLPPGRRWVGLRNVSSTGSVDIDRLGLGSSLAAREFAHRSGGGPEGDAWRVDAATVLRNPVLGATSGMSVLHVRARLAGPADQQHLRVGRDSAIVASIRVDPGPWRWYSVPLTSSGGREDLELALADGTGPAVLVHRVAISPG